MLIPFIQYVCLKLFNIVNGEIPHQNECSQVCMIATDNLYVRAFEMRFGQTKCKGFM